jgi:uncharacterized membrane protein YdbT with pleckstrin-like domain
MWYLEQTLSKDENVIIKGGITIMYFFPNMILFVFLMLIASGKSLSESTTNIILILFLIVWIILFKRFVTFLSTEIVLTDKRMIYKKWLISRNVIELGINQIESISLKQNLDWRVFNYGTLIITWTWGTNEKVEWVKSPLSFREKIYEIKTNLVNQKATI